ncbi:MAG: hypothetical protein AAGE43_01010 [Pseudomonadota bacterium]
MDVSILNTAPGALRARRFLLSGLVAMSLIGSALIPSVAAAFTLVRFSASATVDLNPDDIFQGGAALGPGSDQSFSQGTFPLELADFNQPLDLNLPGPIAGNALSTRLFSNFAFALILNGQERSQCLGDGDFAITLETVSPASGLASGQLNGGEIEVTGFDPIFRGALGRGCPQWLFYGFSIDLEMDNAVAAGSYSAVSEVIVERATGGALQSTQINLQVGMPSMTLLYHPDRVEIDLRATAIAALFGATRSCGSDGCLDLGRQVASVSNPNQPVVFDVAGAVPAVTTRQTITLRNAVGARATGCPGNSYSDASYQIVATSGGIQAGSGSITGLVGAPCGLALRAGDLSFDLDLAEAAGSNASATIQVTVTGI